MPITLSPQPAPLYWLCNAQTTFIGNSLEQAQQFVEYARTTYGADFSGAYIEARQIVEVIGGAREIAPTK
jgi:hypothetical protein